MPVWYQDPHLLRDFRITMPKSWHPWLTPDWAVPDWISAHPHLHGLAVSLAGLAAGAALVACVRLIGSKVLRREAMGDGDIFLMAMVGAFIGWQATVLAFFLAAFLATAAMAVTLSLKLDKEIPYGRISAWEQSSFCSVGARSGSTSRSGSSRWANAAADDPCDDCAASDPADPDAGDQVGAGDSALSPRAGRGLDCS